MSTERSINYVTKTPSADGYGYSCKAFVEAILAADSNFTRVQIDTETSSTYKAWLRVADTNVYLCVYNSSATLSAYLYYGINGTQIAGYGSSVNPSTATHTVGVIVSRIGDWMYGLCFQSSYSSYTLRINFARGVSEYNGATYWFGSAIQQNGAQLGSYTACKPMWEDTLYGLNTNTGIKYTYSNGQNSETTIVTNSTGAAGVLNPVCHYMYSSNNDWCGHIKWGDKYDLYRLFSTSGIYTIDPIGEYTIDGTTYKGLFTQMIIPVACD